MRIMYVSHAATLGGAEQSLIDILKAIRDKIYAVVILPKPGAIEEILNSLGVSYYIYDYPQTKHNVGSKDDLVCKKEYVKTYEAAVAIAELIRKLQIDLVHSNTTVVNVGAMAADMAGKPHIWHLRELMEEDFAYEYHDKNLQKLLFQNAVNCISISDCVHQKYLDTYGVNSIKINDGIDSERFFKKIEEINPDSRNFYVAGSVSRNKGQTDAIEAVNVLVKEGYGDIRLFIAGTVQKQDKWCLDKYITRNGLENNICFCDFSYSLETLRRQCVCSLTTSKMEALGRVAVEAMLAGNIVIGANTGGTAEIVGVDERYGYLYQQGNSGDLAKQMKKVMMLSSSEKRRIRDAAQCYAKKEFDIEAYTEKLLAIYSASINKYTADFAVKGRMDKEYLSVKQEVLEEKEEKVSKTCYIKTVIEKMQTREYITRLETRGISHVAVYGVGRIGVLLLDNLEKSGIDIDYVVDKKENFLSFAYDYYQPEEELPPTEAVIVTIKEAEELMRFYRTKYSYEIIWIQELL